MQLARAGGGVDGVEADGIAGAAPAGVEVTAQIAAHESPVLHGQFCEGRALVMAHVHLQMTLRLLWLMTPVRMTHGV